MKGPDKYSTCGEVAPKLIEAARVRNEPDAALRAHLDRCPDCASRWESEQALSLHLGMLRVSASCRIRPDAISMANVRREALMRQFAETRPSAMQRILRSETTWMLAAAAILLAAIGLGREAARKASLSSIPYSAETTDQAALSDAQQDGFISVPYVPPLAAGESLRIVHTELYPAALATLGVNVDPAWTTELPADLLVGEDGFPRAVRVTGSTDSDSTANDSNTGSF